MSPCMGTDTPARLEPWFNDGNVVLSAEGKLFRVHRSILSSYSEVFRDMFTCPHSDANEEELIDGCPVIHLYDTVDDVEIVLKAMYHRSYMHSHYKEMPFSVASAFLRLGKKYNIPDLFSEAEERIRPHLEPTLLSASGIKGKTEPPWPNLCTGVTQSDPYNIRLMNILREVDLTAYLPLIMFQSALCSPVNPLVNGHKVDGVVYSLSSSNLKSYILIKDLLRKLRTDLSRAMEVVDRNCGDWHCVRIAWRVQQLAELQPFHPFKLETELKRDRHGRICEYCRKTLCSVGEAAIKEFWEALPSVFGFASWKEVRKAGKYGPSLKNCLSGG